jgi:hypothetical protein
MRGDVDTDWVVMTVIDESGKRLVGLRDGRKLGYGQHSDEIYNAILFAVRHAGAAQYEVPEGFRTYDELDGQFTMGIPVEWSISHRTLIATEESGYWGEVIFSDEPVVSDAGPDVELREKQRREALRAIDDGESGAIFVDRREALRGMRCEGFSEKAIASLEQWASEDPLFDQGRGVEESRRTEPTIIDGCTGVRIVWRRRLPEQAERVLDLRVIADEKIVFLFGLRTQSDRYDEDLVVFQKAVASVRLSVAR